MPKPLVVLAKVIQVDKENRNFAAVLEVLNAPFAKEVGPAEFGERIEGAAEFAKEHASGDDSDGSIILDYGSVFKLLLKEDVCHLSDGCARLNDCPGRSHMGAYFVVFLGGSNGGCRDDAEQESAFRYGQGIRLIAVEQHSGCLDGKLRVNPGI